MQELQEKVQTLDSREVAKMVEKRHTDLIRTIENYRNYLDDSQNAKLRSDDFFTESSYRSGTGKKYKCYFITKKGCELIAHKMTGKKHIQFTAAYINKFHEMENKLNSNSSLPQPKAEEITPKYHNGEPVITIQDIVKLSDLNVNTIRYYVRRLERNKDYYLLEWEDLAKFKRNNPSIDKMISSLCVINRQGAEKLAQMIQGVPIQDCFKALPEPKKNKIFNLSSIKPLKYIVDDGIRFSSINNDCFKSWTQSLTWDGIKDVQGIMRERFSDLQKCMEVIDNITVSNDKQLLFFD